MILLLFITFRTGRRHTCATTTWILWIWSWNRASSGCNLEKQELNQNVYKNNCKKLYVVLARILERSLFTFALNRNT